MKTPQPQLRNQTGMTPQQQQQQQPVGIPQWLEQFLYSQGGMQGLLYQVGGIQGLLQLIQQQSQAPRPMPTYLPGPTRPQLSNITGQPITADEFLPDGRPATGRIPYHYEFDPNSQLLGQWTGGRIGLGGYGITPEEQRQLQSIPSGLKGQAFLDALPASLKPTGVTDAMRNTYNTADTAYRAAMAKGAVTPEIQKALADASQAMSIGTYGQMYKSIGPILEPTSTTGGAPIYSPSNQKWGGTYVPYARERILSPQEQRWKALADFGYGTVEGAKFSVDRQSAMTNARQTLKAAGWDPSMGYGPQDWGAKSDFAPAVESRNKLLDSLLFGISPARIREHPEVERKPVLPKAPDPFAGMQSAINRDAYVNETLGGGFYGGLIPDEDAQNTFGGRKLGGAQDPHFPTPQLALNPLPGESKYDTYAGWAADQGAAFGTAPWAVDSQWGHAQNFDDPKLYQQPPPPPTAWQPTPQFGNSWSGTQGWGNTSRNGQNNNAWGNTGNNQQQPMTFGTSPWDNPWGMR